MQKSLQYKPASSPALDCHQHPFFFFFFFCQAWKEEDGVHTPLSGCWQPIVVNVFLYFYKVLVRKTSF